MKRMTSAVVLAAVLTAALSAASIPRPEDFLGFKIGTDRKLADMHKIVEYFRLLDRASPRITVEEVGKTTMGNPFIVAVITSEANHESLERFRRYQQLLADPRKISDTEAEKIIADGRTVVMINCSIHATEIGASQMSMKLAYDLAASDDAETRRILDNVIILLTPMHNPDGIQMVVDWYNKTLGTRYEGSRMPWLYHKYVGHDNNRDWYMFTQKETRLTIKVHNAWHPQIILDMHQMGSRGARLFVPPYVDPYEPNVDPILRQEIAAMGTFIASELTAQGKAGVIHSSRFDAWTPARAYHHYHGGIRILTEAASAKVATPITVKFDTLASDVREPSVKMPLPWKGGRWSLGDIVEYDYAAARAVLVNAAALRENWLRNFYRIHKKAVAPKEKPFAFLVPARQDDLPSAVEMMNVLRTGGVEIHEAAAAFDADGKPYPAGTRIVYAAQPYGGFARTLLEKQVYPEIRQYPGGPLKTPYDVVAHTLPLLMGVKVVRVEKPFQVKARLLARIPKPRGLFEAGRNPFGYIWGHETNDDIRALNRLLAKGYAVSWNKAPFQAEGKTWREGRMIVRNAPGLETELREIARDLYVTFTPLEAGPAVSVLELKPVRLGLYKSWTASMDEGWTRWVFEKYELPYKSVHDADIRKGDLIKDYDVIVLPGMSSTGIVKGLPESGVPPEYAGGIGEVGVENLETFVREGGCLITINASTAFAVKRLRLGVKDAVRGLSRKEFYVPGSILSVLNTPGHPITYGYGRDGAVFFRRSPAFSVMEGTAVVRYPAQCFLSGWIKGEEKLAGKSAVVDVPFEKGRVILIGFPVLYRGQSRAAFRYLFNAVYYGAARDKPAAGT